MSIRISLILLLLAFCPRAHSQSPALPNAYAHNDYWHKRPLFDAIDNGFRNIEADIFLLNGKLIVAHLNPFWKDDRTLESLYFKPLLKLVRDGKITTSRPVMLMIDIKTSGEKTYQALQPLLIKYKDFLTSFRNGRVYPGAVTVVISGNKPVDQVCRQKKRLAFIDKDLARINEQASARTVYPVASCKYSALVTWNGEGDMPLRERSNLMSYVDRAHEQGMKVRLWASPENESVWRALLNCGVDLINTDKLVELRNFLLRERSVYANLSRLTKIRTKE